MERETGMKNMITCVSMVLLLTILMTGCAGVTGGVFGGGTPVSGWAYTGVTVPSQMLHAPLDQNASPIKHGSASALNVLGMIGTGDASIKSAMEDGNITKIHHVDHRITSVLGIFAKWTVIVYGE